VSGICVIELRSHSDRPPVLRAKMQEYIENGANLGWMIDPDARTVEVYRPSAMRRFWPESIRRRAKDLCLGSFSI